MAGAIDLYPRVDFVEVGTPLSELAPEEVQARFEEALCLANEELGEEGTVYFMHQCPIEPIEECVDPARNILLGVRTEAGEEPIDIIDLKGLDESTIKPADALAREMVLKVRQHLLAKKTEGIVIYSSGTKFDPRFLGIHSFGIDDRGYLLIDRCRVLYGDQRPLMVIKASVFHTYTICRMIDEGEGVRLFDDYDLVRRNCRGMFVECASRTWAPSGALREELQADALAFEGHYVVLKRDKLTPAKKEAIIARCRQFSDAL